MPDETQPDETQADLAPGDLAPGDLAPADLAPGDLAPGDLAPGDERRLVDAGVYDPTAPDAADQLELFHYLLGLGATVDDIAASTNLGELAIDRRLRPLGPRTLGEVVEQSGLSWPMTRRFLTAIGLSTDPDRRITDAEAETVRLFAGAAAGVLGEEATVQLARVTGGAMARVAETIVATFRLRFELPRRAAGTRYVDVVKEYAEIAQTMLPGFVTTLDALLRRQIVAVSERMWSTDEERTAVTLPRSVGFADLVDYTTVSGMMSARQLTDVLITFDERTAEIVTGHRGQVVKTIGDEAMFVTEDAGDACAIAIDLVHAFGRDGLPPVRVGLARGEVVSVLGDVYGPDVNLAARLVGLADPATVVASQSVRDAAGGVFAFEALAPVALKGFPGLTPAYRVAAGAASVGAAGSPRV